MLSVIIPTLNAERVLTRTLTPLVAGVADGLVRDCVVADEGSTDETRAMAEAAGCALVRGARGEGWRIGASAAKGDYLLFLAQHLVLERGWIEDARGFIERSGRVATFRLDGESPLAALIAPRGRAGVLIQRSAFNAQAATLNDAARGPMTKLGARAIPQT